MWILIVIGIILFLVIGFLVLAYRASLHCDKCKKLGMEQVKKEEVDRYNTTKRVIEKVKNKKGEVVRTIHKDVPITKIVYSCTYKCKYCGYEEKRKKEEEK